MSESVLDALRSAYFFAGLESVVLDAVAEQCTLLDVTEGAVIFSEGEYGDRLFIVLEGEIQIWKHYGRHDQSPLATYGKGRFFGEMALVDELPRSATALASEPTSLVYLARKDFHGLVHRYPDLGMSVMKSLSAIVRESNDSFVADLNHRNRQLEHAYRELERAQRDLLAHERLSNLGKMSNMILHDIRNPVSVLRGYAHMLTQIAEDPARVRDVAARVAREAERLGHLAAELLDYSRGEVRLDMSVIQPSRIAAAVREYMEDRLRAAGVTLAVEVADDIPIVADYQRIVRALLNVVDNGGKACSRGGRVSLEVSHEGDEAVFRVEDDGEGMEPETAERMFEPFFSRSERGGTGLGMMVVRSIIAAHGGHLEVDSRKGEGTRCTIRIPRGVR